MMFKNTASKLSPFTCRVLSTQPKCEKLPISLKHFNPPPSTYHQPIALRALRERRNSPPPPNQTLSLGGCPMCRQLGMDPHCLSQ